MRRFHSELFTRSMPNHYTFQFVVSLLLLTLMGTLSTAVAQETGKHPLPDATSQQAALKLIRDVFKADYDAAKTSEEKMALAKKMLDLGIATRDDPTGRYVLLRVAKDMAAAEGNLELVRMAVGELAKSFAVDELELRAEALAATAKNTRAKEEHTKIVEQSLALIDQAVEADRYSVVNDLEEVALAAVRQLRDGELLKRVQAKMEDAKRAEEAYGEISDALAKLEQTPTDPEANSAVGRFYCFVKGDWEKGLPMLALGNDPATAGPARRELTESPDPLALGDAWWELAEGEAGVAEQQARARARMWYAKALPAVQGLTRARVNTRLAANAVDLLQMIDVDKHVVWGDWRKTSNALAFLAKEPQGAVQAPYVPADEYRVEIAVKPLARRPNGWVLLVGLRGAGQKGPTFHAVFDDVADITGIQMLGGQLAAHNETGHKGPVLKIGELNTIAIEVRANRITVACNGQPVAEYQGDQQRLTNHHQWEMPHDAALFVGGGAGAAFEIHKWQVIPLVGEGQRISADQFAEYSGGWRIQYRNGVEREYYIHPNGGLDGRDVNNGSPTRGVLKKTPDGVVSVLHSGNIERYVVRQGRLLLEHFNPATGFPDKPSTVAVGRKVRP